MYSRVNKEIERQNDNTLKLANIETLRKKLHIERDIEKDLNQERDIIIHVILKKNKLDTK